MPYVRSRQQQRGIRHFENGVDEEWSRNLYGAFCRGRGHRLLSSLHLFRSLMGPGDATPSLSQVIELSPCFTLQVLTSMALSFVLSGCGNLRRRPWCSSEAKDQRGGTRLPPLHTLSGAARGLSHRLGQQLGLDVVWVHHRPIASAVGKECRLRERQRSSGNDKKWQSSIQRTQRELTRPHSLSLLFFNSDSRGN